MSLSLEPNVPPGAIQEAWDRHRFGVRLVNPSNKRRFSIIVVGTGLAGASAAATLAELGYHVKVFTFHDSPRRAHSIAAQGGINATKDYRNDGDSIFRLFYDTIKGGDFRAREANVYRLARVSSEIIDRTSPRSPSWWRRRSPTPKRGPMVTSGNGSSRVGAAIATPHTRPSTKPT
jgi:succinate dehydrogenase / fumarate reductase flavoprotein subunit